jgi:NAD(P)-dependent dehydrogenase (short-subunit alcohol dehydrogenase family)
MLTGVQRLIQDTGRVDILVNNAGFWELAPTEDTTEADEEPLGG